MRYVGLFLISTTVGVLSCSGQHLHVGDDANGGISGAAGTAAMSGGGGDAGAGGLGGQAGGSGSAGSAPTGGEVGDGGAAGAAGGQVAGGTNGGAGGVGGIGGAAIAGNGGMAGGDAGGVGLLQGCNGLVNTAPLVNKDHTPGPPPVMAGGTIVSGTYYLTKVVQYNGEILNMPSQETYVFSNGTFEAITLTGRVSGSYATSGTNLTLKFTCSGGAPIVMAYTASATQIVWQYDQNEAHTLTLQTNATGLGGASGNGGACTDLAPTGSPVPETMGNGSAPTPGAPFVKKIPTGVYLLTGWTVYSPATADPSRSRTLMMRAQPEGIIEIGGTDSSTGRVDAAFSYSLSGATLTRNWVCGAAGIVQQGLSIGSNTVSIYNLRSGGVEVETWTIQ